MGIVGERGRRSRVAHLSGDVGNWGALRQQSRREHVADVVEAEAWELRLREHSAPCLGDIREIERGAGVGAKSHGGTSGQPRLSVSAFRSIESRWSARASSPLMSTMRLVPVFVGTARPYLLRW